MAYHINNMTLLIRTTKSEKVFSSLLKCPINNDDMAERLDVYPTEKYIVGTVTLIFALLNFLITFAVTMALFRMKSMRNSFGYLNISHGIADCFVLIMFIVWFAPMLMLNSELGHTLVGIRLSQLTGLFMCGSVHSAIAIAFSRYVALIHPLRYSIFFTKQRTIKFAAFAWTIALIHHVPNIFPDCFYYFDFRRYAWMYNDTQCGQFLSWFTDLCYGLTMLMLVGGPNLATIFQLHQASKAKSALAIIEAQSIKRQRREWRFFLQAFMSSTIIMIIFMTFHLVKKTMTLRFIHFLTSCLCVILVHGTNSIVLLVCSQEMRSWFSQIIKRSEKPTKSISSLTNEPYSSKISCVTRSSIA